jgi:hypothetical protein
MTQASDVERANSTETAAMNERDRRLREQVIRHGELSPLLPTGTHAAVVRVIEAYLAMAPEQRTEVLRLLEEG